MEASAGTVIREITGLYSEELKLFRRLLDLVQLQGEAVAAGDMLGLSELLQAEDGIMAEIRRFQGLMRRLQAVLLPYLPVARAGVEQFACLMEPEVYIKYRKALDDLKYMLAQITAQKRQHAFRLAQKARNTEESEPVAGGKALATAVNC